MEPATLQDALDRFFTVEMRIVETRIVETHIVENYNLPFSQQRPENHTQPQLEERTVASAIKPQRRYQSAT